MAKGKTTKKKAAKMEQAHGALSPTSSVYELISREISPYKEKNISEYSDALASMDIAELHDHAIKMGQVPIGNRSLLVDRLEKEYARSKGKLRQEFSRNETFAMTPGNKAIALKILRG